ncbi:MAG TPA: anti-sigma regulatory factor [Gemmatimonadaceae bacterium]|nr:anti-sigma regulatory factor [Gemmatimonadaceae bacterium]
MTAPFTVTKQVLFQLKSDVDVVAARQGVRNWAREIGLTVLDLTKIVTAASELARNALVHGGGGVMSLEVVQQLGREGLRLTFKDRGPGIPEIAVAMQDGYTTGRGMGIGLPGAKRLVNEFDVFSQPGEGTCVTIVRWKA